MGDNRVFIFLVFFNGVNFHSPLYFQEVLSQYLWNERSILKVEEKTIIFQFWVQMGILDRLLADFTHFWVEMGPFQIQNVHF